MEKNGFLKIVGRIEKYKNPKSIGVGNFISALEPCKFKPRNSRVQ